MRDPLNADWNVGRGADPIAGAEEGRAALETGGLIDFSLLSDVFENFLEVVGLPVAIIDLTGQVLASSRWQRICMEFHRVHPQTLARCIESDTELSRAVAEGKDYAIYRCRNGLTDCATPIVVEGVHVANLFVGQFFLAPPDPAHFQHLGAELGFDRAGYATALAEVPIVSEEKLPAILRLIGGLAQQIARQSLAEQRIKASFQAVERQVDIRTRELAESHERLRKIADQVPGVVYQFQMRGDGTFCVPYVSDTFTAMFGAQPAEVRDDAAKVFERVLPDDLEAFVGSIRASAADLSLWKNELRIRRPDGSVRWLGGEAQPQREHDGSILWHGFISDITERKRTEMLLNARLRLSDVAASSSLHDVLVATLDEACALTGAETGFYHFLLADQETLSLQAWSTRTTREFCQAVDEPRHYDVCAAGVWADAVRQRRSVVYNDYPSLPHRQGLPEGHAEVRRLMSVPIQRDGRIVAVIGVGNKPTDFDDEDLRIVETLADLAWDLADRQRAVEALAERNALIQRRYKSLRALNDIAALAPGGSAHPLDRALEVGARHLGLPFGIIARVEDERYTIAHMSAPPDAGFGPGQVLELGQTFCAITLTADDVVAIAHVGASDHAGHPCYKLTGLEAYIAVPLRVDGRVYGTVNFSSPQPSTHEFDEGDLEFMRLLGRWVAGFLERERAEAEVVAAKETAEERARELANSNSDLEQFAYVASHDLRQPLRMVNSYLALIERRYAERLDDEGREFIGFARDGALQMDQLILDLLEYSRVGRSSHADEVLDLADVIGQASGLLRLLAEETGATLVVETRSACVCGNRSELVRLFQNLIGNAIKYRAPDRPIHVAVGWRDRGGEWLVSVADNGIGIAAEYHQDIFKIFRRLHTSREYEGTGIGLAICQKIVKNHGGRIWLESEPGRGSTFHVALPMDRSSHT